MRASSRNGGRPGFAFLLPYVRTYARPFLAAVFFLSIEATCDLMQPTIMSHLIDRGVAAGDIGVVLSLGATMLLVAALGALGAIARNVISSRVSQSFGTVLRADLYRRIQAFSFSSLDRFESASLITRLTNDVNQVQNFANGLMRIFVKAPLLAIGGIVMAVLLNAPMSVVLLVVVPVVAALIATSLRTSYPLFRRIQVSLDSVNAVMREYLSGVRVVKAFNRFDHEEERFARANGELSLSMTRAMRVMAVFSPLISLSLNLGIAAVLWFGGMRVGSGKMQVGQVVAFVNYMTQILGSLMMLSFIFNMFVRARASAERIAEVFAGETEGERAMPQVDPRPPAQHTAAAGEPAIAAAAAAAASLSTERDGGPARARGWSLGFESVGLRYAEAGEPALKGISFACEAGSTIGIIGSTGSGKTSLVNLIPRFYEVSSGRILVDGRDLKEWEMGPLREGIALVPQHSLLFTGTVLENLLWGKTGASMGEIVAAATAASAHDFVSSFPEGYQTHIGRGGFSVSGGQRQRLAIARALVRRPRILILDDSTSSVDSITEARIRKSLAADLGGTTVLLITQRISSVRGTDLILVLDEGELVGQGSHEELIGSCEVYRDIYRSQVGGREAVHG